MPVLFAKKSIIAIASLAGSFCGVFAVAAPEDRSGAYEIVSAKRIGCQARQEFYYRAEAGKKPVYLGACFTPSYLTRNLKVDGDRSCYAVAASGQALVYFHRPNVCGAGARAKAKPGGVYRHVAGHGETLLYAEDEVGQIWTGADIDPHSILVSWRRADPNAKYGVCSRKLFISADGSETFVDDADSPNKCSSD